MRITLMTITTALLLLGGGAATMAVENHDAEWEILIKYGDGMAVQGTTYADESCTFLWHFSEERKGVSFLGDNPAVDMNEIFGDLTDQRTGSRSVTVSGGRPDLIAVLTIKIDPLSRDELKVKMRVTRWQLLDEPPPYDYRFETEAHINEIGVGDSYVFNAGTGPDGKEYFLEMTIAPAGKPAGNGSWTVRKPVGSGSWTLPRSKPRPTPIRFKYRLVTPPIKGRAEFESVRDFVLFGDDELKAIEIEAPIDIAGVDSSMLSVDIKLKDIFLREVVGGNRYEIDAVFELERWLMIDIKPSDDPTRINLSQMISSSYNHAIHLKPNKKIRIEIPEIESGKHDLNAREIIEIEPVVIEKKPQ